MDTSRILKLLLIAEIAVLLFNAAIISRDYQDSGVLEGLEIPFIVFMITYAAVFVFEKDTKWMVPLAVMCNLTLMLIPNLKYNFFQGNSIDQHVQYSLAQYVHDEGSLAVQATFNRSRAHQYYMDTPLMHLAISLFSVLTETPVIQSYKYLPVLWSSIFPLITYTIIKNLKLMNRHNLLKYALFLSFVPIIGEFSGFSGGTFGTILIFLILSELIILMQKKDRSHLVLSFFFCFTLVLSHSFSSMQLILLISLVAFLSQLFHNKLKAICEIRMLAIVFLLMNLMWYVCVAQAPLEHTWNTLVHSLFRAPASGFIPSRFFELVQVNILESFKVILVYHGADIFIGFLTIVGVAFIVIKRKMQSKELVFLSLFIISIYSFLIVGLILHVGGFYFRRMIKWPLLVSPIFVSIFFNHMNKNINISNILKCTVIPLFIVLTTIEFFPSQSIIPSSNILSDDFPADEPLVYIDTVNSIYQRHMINYVETHVRGRIACDAVTRSQILGLTRHNFSQQFVVWFYPFSIILDENTPEKKYDYFLTHLPGKSGGFQEKVEIRTRNFIVESLDSNYNILYSNSGSYICSKLHLPNQSMLLR